MGERGCVSKQGEGGYSEEEGGGVLVVAEGEASVSSDIVNFSEWSN